MNGFSVKHSMDKIREIIGVCPQFDILWPDLTVSSFLLLVRATRLLTSFLKAREHLQILSQLKAQLSKEDMDRRLEDVKLTKVADHVTSTFSGKKKFVPQSMIHKNFFLHRWHEKKTVCGNKYHWRSRHHIYG